VDELVYFKLSQRDREAIELLKRMRDNEKDERAPKARVMKIEPSLANIFISGPVIESYRFQKPVFLRSFGQSGWHGGRKKKEEFVSVRKFENRLLTLNRTRNKIRRLTLTNFDTADSKFITLTFSDNKEVKTKHGVEYNFKHFDASVNKRSAKSCNQLFADFRKRLYKKLGEKFEYIAVIEFQDGEDGNGRGVVHYHMIANIPFIEQKKFAEEIWGHGFVLMTNISNVDNVGQYISSYLTQDLNDYRLEGVKAYNCSKGLEQPTKINGHDAVHIANELAIEKEGQRVFKNEYPAQFVEGIKYEEYNIIRDKRKYVRKSEELVDELKGRLCSLYKELDI
jgi:hypothetical protein